MCENYESCILDQDEFFFRTTILSPRSHISCNQVSCNFIKVHVGVTRPAPGTPFLTLPMYMYCAPNIIKRNRIKKGRQIDR